MEYKVIESQEIPILEKALFDSANAKKDMALIDDLLFIQKTNAYAPKEIVKTKLMRRIEMDNA